MELPQIFWFATDGSFSALVTRQDAPWTSWSNDASYAAPAVAGATVDLWVVAQDFRGGADWRHLRLRLQDP